jgi:hypothetical protein
MPRLQTLHLAVHTGGVGTSTPVRIRINGFTVPVKPISGDTGPRMRWEGKADINSVVHSLELLGPTSGQWGIAELVATFHTSEGQHAHTLRELTLGEQQALNIWTPEDSFSV